jgi:hypothetical protein
VAGVIGEIYEIFKCTEKVSFRFIVAVHFLQTESSQEAMVFGAWRTSFLAE